MAGLFFCLASDTVQGFYFCPATREPPTSVYSGFYPVSYTANATKQRTGLYRCVSVDLTHYSAHNTASCTSRLCTACDTPEGIPSSAAPPLIPDTTATPDAVQGRAAAYYNNVYKDAAVRPVMNPCPAGSPVSGAWRAARNH